MPANSERSVTASFTLPVHRRDDAKEEQQEHPPPATKSPFTCLDIWEKLQIILRDGPASASEWWIYELMKWLRRDPDAVQMRFDIPALWLGFRILKDNYSVHQEFYSDICHLVTMLPLKDEDDIERTLLIELILRSAKECDCAWWTEPRERAAVVFGVMHACSVHRRVASKVVGDELSELMSKVALQRVEVAVMDKLADSLDDMLKIKL